MKTKGFKEADFLALIERVLPKTIADPQLVERIYSELAREIRLVNSLQSFARFCEKEALPDAQPETITQFKEQLGTNFGDENVTIVPDEKGEAVAVEIALPDRTVTAQLKVRPPGVDEGEDSKAPFVPFPVSLPDDPELVWVLGRREDLGPDEAARALAKIEEEFWATKAGQKALKEGSERTFAEFISLASAAALKDSGLKRHYKAPEALRTLRLLSQQASTEEFAAA
jgi:hypothetical protein